MRLEMQEAVLLDVSDGYRERFRITDWRIGPR
jgi:hypothetical protein